MSNIRKVVDLSASRKLLRTPKGPGHVAATLKSLREQYGVSMRELADALGKAGASSWQHYEARFKGALLPLDIAQKIAPLFASRGCDPKRIWDLAGLSDAPSRADPPKQGATSIRAEVEELNRLVDEIERRLKALREQLR